MMPTMKKTGRPAVPYQIRGLRRLAVAGALLGGLTGVLAFAPAAWLARAAFAASGEHLLLADARGTVWSGSAVAVLGGGAGSRSATVLPGRLHWTLGWEGGAVALRARQACCLSGEPRLRLQAGLRRLRIELLPGTGAAIAPAASGAAAASARPAAEGPIGRWPAAWLAGLGTPWNTLQLEGELRLATRSLAFERVQGRWRVDGGARLDVADVASRLSTLPSLGSYRLQLDGDGGETPRLALSTTGGPLRLNASGSWGADGLQLRGEAHAAPGAERALDNLLNLIGRRQGERSLIAIG